MLFRHCFKGGGGACKFCDFLFAVLEKKTFSMGPTRPIEKGFINKRKEFPPRKANSFG